jgi:hypothetical protein
MMRGRDGLVRRFRLHGRRGKGEELDEEEEEEEEDIHTSVISVE